MKDLATKALCKLAGPHVPASLTKLEQAVKRVHAAHERAERDARQRRQTKAAPNPLGERRVDDDLEAAT